MPDREAKKKTEIKKSAVSAPVEIGKPKEGSEKDIRWYVIHTYSGYENKVKDTLPGKCTLWEWMIQLSRFSFPCMTRKK